MMSAVRVALILFVLLSLGVMNPWVWEETSGKVDPAVMVSFAGIILLALIGVVFGVMSTLQRKS